MMQQPRKRLGFAIALAVCLIGTAPFVPAAAARRSPAVHSTQGPAGATTTRLADGRWLMVGGEGPNGPLASAAIVDPVSGATMPLPSGLQQARAGHTATLLPDGSVLIFGGVGAHGDVLATPERFVPGTAAFEALSADGLAPRANHTATLLTDGRVLLVGGTAASIRDDADLWDSATGRGQPLAATLQTPRTGHHAVLEADGRVLIVDGHGADGQRLTALEEFDPSTLTFQALNGAPVDPATFSVSAVMPGNNARDVPLDTIVALRFSQIADVASVSESTVTLSGPDGPVAIARVPAEGGRLLFVRALDSLVASTTYQVTVSGIVASTGVAITPVSFSFTTKDDPNQSVKSDDETWTPGGDGWTSGRKPSPWQNLPPLSAGPGVTALAGQVLRLNGAPLADVTLVVAGHEARSDRTGRFLVLLPGTATGRYQLEIRGASASRPGRTYGFFEAGLKMTAGQTNVLPYTIWMPLLDTAHVVTIASPTTQETVVTTPFIPGLELHLPAGAVIRGEDGQVVRQLGITPIPVDRPPFPLATGVEVPIYFTIQPGGAYVSNVNRTGPQGAQLVYPNYRHVPTGVVADFWHYDPDVLDWYVYGTGMVRGGQVFPGDKTRLYKFTGAMINTGNTPPPSGPPPTWKATADPVDPSTGLYVLEETDLVLPDVMPLAVRRTYRPADPASRPFGTGQTQEYAMFLHSEHQYTEADLILPDGARVHYVRTSGGTGFADAVFEHTASPTRFYKSTIAWNGDGWDLTLKDGTVYVFGNEAPLQSIRDRYGNVTRLTWSQTGLGGSGIGNILRVTSPNGRWIAFTYDAASPVNHVTQVQDNLGRTVAYTYDANGNLSTVTDPEHNVTTYTWDASNRLVSIKDGRNITWLTNQYDTSNRVTQQTLADPNATYSMAYTTDGNGNITQTAITDPRGHVEQLSFNADHYVTTDVVAVGQPEQRTTTIERQTGSDFPTAVVDGLNRRTEYTYDTTGHLLTVTRLAGTQDALTTTFTYEPTFFQLATVTDPLNHTWTLGYDAAGRPTSAGDPLGHQMTVTLNPLGQVTASTDALQHTWQFGYTGGDQTSVTNPVGAVSHRVFDAAGRVIATADPLGRVTRLVPDNLNRVASVTDPLGGQTSFQYDPNSRLLSLTDALNHATSYTYDTSDRTATRTDPLLSVASYAYDLEDNLTRTIDRKGQITTYQYDALDRLTQVTYDDTSTTQYTYDAGDRVTQVVDSVAGTITRGYDGLDQLTSETTPEGSVSYTYDADGRRQTMTVAGQPAITYGYDNAHRLTSITQGDSVAAFTYDDADRRLTLTLPNGIVTSYGYDDANELTSLTYTFGQTTLGTLTYAYDLAGNRTSVGGSWARTGLPEALASASYDAANRIQTWGGQAFGHDPNGNFASDGLTSYAWNARDQLSGISGATSAAFAYDGLARRRSKAVGGTTTNLLYDGVNLVEELSGSTPTASLLTGGQVDETLTRTDAAGTSTLLADALGSTLELTDSSGALQTHYTYEPYGASTVSGATTGNALQFTGREDDHIGLQFNRARYYSQELQRFISEDPIEFAGGTTNLHQYVAGDPVNRTDPLGMQAWPMPAPSPAPGIPWLPESLMDSLIDWLSDLVSGTPGPYPAPLDRYSKEARTRCEKSRRGCKPCVPPVGTIAFRIDDKPDSLAHFSKPLQKYIPAPHWTLYVMQQSPPDVVDPCRCQWKSLIDLLGGLGNGPTPSGTVPITPPAGGGGLPIRAGGW